MHVSLAQLLHKTGQAGKLPSIAAAVHLIPRMESRGKHAMKHWQRQPVQHCSLGSAVLLQEHMESGDAISASTDHHIKECAAAGGMLIT